MKITRPEVQESIVHSGGLTDLMDNMIKLFYNITDDELDKICDLATTEEIELFIQATGKEDKPATFCEIRKGFIVRNKYVEYFQK
jgi:hypothetical protein